MPTLDTSGILEDDVLFDSGGQWQIDSVHDRKQVLQAFKVSVENTGIEILGHILIIDDL